MDDDIIQAYLWKDVIELGFRITKHKEWIKAYLGSLKGFWGVSEYPCTNGPRFENDSIKAEIENPDLELWWEFDLRINEHFHLEFNHLSGNVWWHHSDFEYYILPIEKMLDKRARSIAVAEFSSNDLEIVLDAMIFHGSTHQHIKSPFPKNKIRIGGGIDNPFLYLFHLRYQFCPDKSRRDDEKNRLIRLFESAVKNDTPVTDNDLLLVT
ncbi:MAG: hypothetical protein ACUZ8O_12750 [Candidatus Anammoxibacter sp.]